MKKKLLYITILLISSVPSIAQTSHHDSSKMNQFLVKETGAGALSPTTYYYTLHRGYQSWAQESPKLLWRTNLRLALPKEETYADSIQADLKSRAEVEAANMADRNRITNITWATQQQKMDNKLSQFSNNIERICPLGGTPGERKAWLTIYNQITCGINVINKSYLSNSRRLKAYLNLYDDVVKFNNQLCKRLACIDSHGIINFDNGVELTSPNRKAICKSSYSRWQIALYSSGSGVVK